MARIGNSYMRGYAVKALINNPTWELAQARDAGEFPFSHQDTRVMGVYLPRLMGSPGGHSWDPLLEAEGDRSPRVGFRIPEVLLRQEVDQYLIETTEVGEAEDDGEDLRITFGFVATGPHGQCWSGQRSLPSHNPKDWHTSSSGYLSLRHRVGRVGIVDGNLLNIDEAFLSVYTDKRVAIVQSEVLFSNYAVGQEPPDLATITDGLETWQPALNALYDRIACGGCDYMHYDEWRQ